MDTITLIRSAIRGLLAATASHDADLAGRLRAVLDGGDDYINTGKPVIDWADQRACEALVDCRARDGYALLALLDGLTGLSELVGQAGQLLATVLGQDLEAGEAGTLRIARKVAPDRVISTVDPEARHGHKTNHRGFDGYKGHIAIDPDAEVITATAVTAGNTGDAQPAAALITDLTDPAATELDGDTAAVYGDAAYGAGEILDHPGKIWINGHEWAKRQAPKAGIQFTQVSNGFTACDDPRRCRTSATGSAPVPSRCSSSGGCPASHCRWAGPIVSTATGGKPRCAKSRSPGPSSSTHPATPADCSSTHRRQPRPGPTPQRRNHRRPPDTPRHHRHLPHRDRPPGQRRSDPQRVLPALPDQAVPERRPRHAHRNRHQPPPRPGLQRPGLSLVVAPVSSSGVTGGVVGVGGVGRRG
jgi:hypothetical protein